MNYTYKTLTNTTPTAVASSVAVDGTPGLYTITVTNTSAFFATILSIKLVSNLTKNYVIPVNISSLNRSAGLSVSFNATLNAGSYNLVINTSPYGYVSISSIITATTTITTPSSQEISFNGGNYTITSPNLSPVSYITVAGFRGNLISCNSTAATYNVPPIVTS